MRNKGSMSKLYLRVESYTGDEVAQEFTLLRNLIDTAMLPKTAHEARHVLGKIADMVEERVDVGPSIAENMTERSALIEQCRNLMRETAKWYWKMIEASPDVTDGFEHKLTFRGGRSGYNDGPMGEEFELYDVRVRTSQEKKTL